MTTIYAVYNSEGCVGRCDSKCHNALKPDCVCVCGGAHHGIGTKAAVEDRKNVSDDELIQEAKKLFGPGQYRISRKAEQLELFSCQHQKP